MEVTTSTADATPTPKALPEISCDRCIAPGTCCRSFPLSQSFWLGTTPDEIREWLKEEGFPFEPLRRDQVWPDGASDAYTPWKEKWLFRCPKVSDDGRCTIYEDRPKLCRVYQPGHDHMCVHMRLPNGAPVIPQLPIIPETAQ